MPVTNNSLTCFQFIAGSARFKTRENGDTEGKCQAWDWLSKGIASIPPSLLSWYLHQVYSGIKVLLLAITELTIRPEKLPSQDRYPIDFCTIWPLFWSKQATSKSCMATTHLSFFATSCQLSRTTSFLGISGFSLRRAAYQILTAKWGSMKTLSRSTDCICLSNNDVLIV